MKYLCPICKCFYFMQKHVVETLYLFGGNKELFTKRVFQESDQVRCRECDHLLELDELIDFHKYVDNSENCDYSLMEEMNKLVNKPVENIRKNSTKVNIDGKHYDIISTIEIKPSLEN